MQHLCVFPVMCLKRILNSKFCLHLLTSLIPAPTVIFWASEVILADGTSPLKVKHASCSAFLEYSTATDLSMSSDSNTVLSLWSNFAACTYLKYQQHCPPKWWIHKSDRHFRSLLSTQPVLVMWLLNFLSNPISTFLLELPVSLACMTTAMCPNTAPVFRFKHVF